MVFPTPVGMFRFYEGWALTRLRFPHPRGDVPQTKWKQKPFEEFSPPPWGCSASLCAVSGLRPVFPTPVGMFRLELFNISGCGCFPHPRGDVPAFLLPTWVFIKFSPPPWGCSVEFEKIATIEAVFPTPVGMFRIGTKKWSLQKRFPHPRGDVPPMVMLSCRCARFSPPPWGCSVTDGANTYARTVFPTPVGMFRRHKGPSFMPVCFPHPRGDVPLVIACGLSSSEFSPPPWGCSVRLRTGAKLIPVFPTPVGMFRLHSLDFQTD